MSIPEPVLSTSLGLGKKALFYCLGEISSRLQKRYFPFKTDRLVLALGDPRIALDYESYICRIDIPIGLKNFSLYDVEVVSCHCEVTLGTRILVRVNLYDRLLLQGNSPIQHQYDLQCDLTEFHSKVIESKCELKNESYTATCYSRFDLSFTLRTVHGYHSLMHNIEKNVLVRKVLRRGA